MKCVIQRVSQASVTVNQAIVGQIDRRLLVLFGVEKDDEASKLDYHVGKLLKLRIFPDEQGKMNRSVQDIHGGILVVSQFTLAGDCRKGNRPGFDNAKAPKEAEQLYLQLVQKLRQSSNVTVETGVFGADMQVSLVNDGPVTFILEN